MKLARKKGGAQKKPEPPEGNSHEGSQSYMHLQRIWLPSVGMSTGCVLASRHKTLAGLSFLFAMLQPLDIFPM